MGAHFEEPDLSSSYYVLNRGTGYVSSPPCACIYKRLASGWASVMLSPWWSSKGYEYPGCGGYGYRIVEWFPCLSGRARIQGGLAVLWYYPGGPAKATYVSRLWDMWDMDME